MESLLGKINLILFAITFIILGYLGLKPITGIGFPSLHPHFQSFIAYFSLYCGHIAGHVLQCIG